MAFYYVKDGVEDTAHSVDESLEPIASIANAGYFALYQQNYFAGSLPNISAGTELLQPYSQQDPITEQIQAQFYAASLAAGDFSVPFFLSEDATTSTDALLNATLGALTGSAAATLGITATANGNLSPLIGSGAGNTSGGTIEGTHGGNLGALTGSANATLSIAASAGGTLGAMLSSGAGSVWVNGVAGGQLGGMTGSGAGNLQIAGTATQTLGALQATGSATLSITATASGLLSPMTCSATATISDVNAGSVLGNFRRWLMRRRAVR